MIIYLAGNGRHAENDSRLPSANDVQWGVLLSYRDLQVKSNDGSKRFKRIKNKRREHTNEDQ